MGVKYLMVGLVNIVQRVSDKKATSVSPLLDLQTSESTITTINRPVIN